MEHATFDDTRLKRCAVYTRKSVATGLDKPINSIETQREVYGAYIKSQAHRNWVEIPRRYGDGGFSGGTMERPALQQMVNDIESGQIDIVVIYKVDRLSRSLTDFVRLMDVLDRYGASFVSVTQTFDTSDSMGRLVLNILLTFAQFERELSSERIRDRCAARRKRGLFPGGMPPIGYRVVPRTGKLIPDLERADTVRELFQKFEDLSANRLGQMLEQRGFKTYSFGCRHGNRDRAQRFSASNILKILRNPIYAGHFVYNGELVKSQIEPLVSLETWHQAQKIIRTRHPCVRDPTNNFLLGILHDEVGRRMKIVKNQGGTKKARYYRTEATGWARGYGVHKIHVDADRIESLTLATISSFLTDRIKLKETVLSLGLYSDQTARMIRNGPLAARRLALLERPQIRGLIEALVVRAEVNSTRLQLLICCYELCRFLQWDGNGIFTRAHLRPKGADRFRMLYAPANLICTRPDLAVPVGPRKNGDATPDADLVGMLHKAADLREHMLANRDLTFRELGNERAMGPRIYARYVRLSYLAPDIQTAIMDGTQPPGLTPNTFLFSALPLDWEQQRRLFGFPSPSP